jgi:probable rRNA maturation factor
MKPVVFTRNQQRRLRVDRRLLLQMVDWLLAEVQSPLAELGIILVTDAQIADYNLQFHHRTGPTDILTFHYEGMGELVISAEHVLANAKRFHTTPACELALYVIHGILHLHGYDDRTTRQRQRMRRAERALLGRLGRVFCLPELTKMAGRPK